MTRGWRIARLLGIDIHLDASLVIIAGLILANLGLGAFPAWHPDWSVATIAFVAVAATVAFFASILAHELSHAVVAQLFGIPVERITLFVFGGVANIEEEPPHARAELLMAAAGPFMSLLIGAASLFAGAMLLPTGSGGGLDAIRAAGPLATVLLWLGPVNVALGLFNMLPGFPLDGGRVLRAILWWITGSLRTATRVATLGGRLVGSLFVIAGVAMVLGVSVPPFGRGAFSGIWIGLIGLFLSNAARSTWAAFVMRDALREVTVARVMTRRQVPVDPDLPVSRFVSEFLMATEMRSFPVERAGVFEGVVSLHDVGKVPRDVWETTPVRHIMTPAESLPSVGRDADAGEVLDKLSRSPVDEIPVVHESHLEGVVRREDLAKWLALHESSREPH